MVVFLNVFRKTKDGKKKLGTLEIGENQGTDGNPIGYFEWRGANGTDDGGTWKWEKDYYGFFVMRLTSNRNGAQIGDVSDESWGSLAEPARPYFKPDSTGSFWYNGPTGGNLQIVFYERI